MRGRRPMLFVGGMSGRVYVATNYTHQGNHPETGKPLFVSAEKYDVTDDFYRCLAELGKRGQKSEAPA